MMSRRNFTQTGLLTGGAMAMAAYANTANAESRGKAYLDKLTDDSGKYAAAPLPFSYDALEPVIDARTVELHYNFHHKPAVAAANNAEAALAKARDSGDFALVKHYEKGGEPKGDLAKAIARDFASFAKFKAHMLAASTTVESSGWGLMGYHPSTQRLMILQCENHQKLTAWGIVPLLLLDVFEHAYYLKYQNKRGEYLSNLFNIINWDNVAERLDGAIS
jgi:Fe-Mn family superoxide dismutase